MEDTSIKSIFDHLSQPPQGSNDAVLYPAVFATWVQQNASQHPPVPAGNKISDLVKYASGRLMPADDKKTLSGKMKIWRNIDDPGYPAFFGMPAKPADAFADASSSDTIAITLSDAGTVKYQEVINGVAMTTKSLAAAYGDGLMVEKLGPSLRSLSFTLGWVLGG